MAKYAVIKEATIYDDYDVNVDEWRECYEEHCEINDITPEEETPYDFIYDMLNMEWEDMFRGMKHSKYNDECVVLGCLGLWYGSRNIIPTKENTLADAIKKCVSGCDYARIKIVDGHIEIKAIHHDGTNDFEIHILNKLGQNTMGADLTKECYHCKIKEDFWG